MSEEHTWEDTLREVEQVSRRHQRQRVAIDPLNATQAVREMLRELYDEDGILLYCGKCTCNRLIEIMDKHGFDGYKRVAMEEDE